MTFSELRSLVLSLTDDLSGGYFTQAQVDKFLNNALRELQKKLILCYENWYVKCVRATMTASEQCYYLPADFLQMNRFDIILSGTTPATEARNTLMPLTLQEARLINFGPGQPKGYFLKKDSFNVAPAPDQGYEIEMLYTYRVPEMVNDTDTPDAPEEWHEFIAILATLDCFIKDREGAPQTLLDKKKSYEDRLDAMANNRTVDAPRKVVLTEESPGVELFF